jgi:hypothetical protein
MSQLPLHAPLRQPQPQPRRAPGAGAPPHVPDPEAQCCRSERALPVLTQH